MAKTKGQKLVLNLKKIANGLLKAGFQFEKDTKATIKSRSIWDTGDLWGAVTADNKVKQSKNEMSVTVRVLSSKLGKKKRSAKTGYKRNVKVNYAKFVHFGTRYIKARPFFDWTYDKQKKKYDKIILNSVNVDIK